MYTKNGVDYPSYGAYLRSKNLSIDTGYDGRKAWDAEITAYKEARRQGVQPAGTKMQQIQDAMIVSDTAGKAYDAATGGFN